MLKNQFVAELVILFNNYKWIEQRILLPETGTKEDWSSVKHLPSHLCLQASSMILKLLVTKTYEHITYCAQTLTNPFKISSFR